MGKTILTNVRAFAAGLDLTGTSNKIELAAEVEEKDATTYGSQGWKEVLGGLPSSTLAGEGLWESGPGELDPLAWADLGRISPWTVVPVGGAAVGDAAYLTQMLRADYKIGGAIGDIAPWTSKAAGSWPLVRGRIAHPPGTARTATGTGTGVQLGAVTAGKRLYACLHVLSAAGTTPSITIGVESDDSNTFSSASTRLTFDAATAAGGQAARTDGTAVTDTWWRLSWSVTGTGPSFLFLAALGIA